MLERSVCFVIIFCSIIYAQINISGQIKDIKTNKPIPFVNISYHSSGTTTDIDGKFTLKIDKIPASIKISCIGYKSKQVEISNSNFITINLIENATEINLVQIDGGENPANGIIRKVIKNRTKYNPFSLQSFSYETYNKTIFTGEKDTAFNLLQNIVPNDSLNIMVEKIFNNQHLFISESVTNKKYKKPNQILEEIVSSKTSGMKDALFSTLTTQLQSLSFYDNENFKILNTEYINPIANDGLGMYSFYIIDTTIINNDSIFAISFKPKAAKKFKALKGILYVNITDYALQMASASPVKKDQLHLSITQVYEKKDSTHWFPTQLSTDMSFLNIKLGKFKIVVNARTYIKNVMINPALKNKEFSDLEVEVKKDALLNIDTILPRYRITDLSVKDSNTYKVVDSIGGMMNISKRLDFIEALLEGKIRVSVLDFPIDRVLGFNVYEGFRLGLGVETNHRLLKWMKFGGYAAYGFTDNAFKYGAHLEFIVHKRKDLRFRFDYKQDLLQSGFTDFIIKSPLVISNITNNIVLNRFDSIQSFEGSINYRPRLNISLRLNANYQIINPTYNYRYLPDTNHNQKYHIVELDFAARYAIGEKYILLGNTYIAQPTKYPILHIGFTQSIPNTNGVSFSYTKLMMRINQTFTYKRLGKTMFMVEGGSIFGDAPYVKLFAQRGGYNGFSIVNRNAFETMFANEFIMDKYISVFIAHNFGTIFRVKKFMRPEIVLMHNLGFGWLNEPNRHSDVNFKTMEKGFFEGGIVIDNILVLSNLGVGFGTFYRYGSYSDTNPVNNFYFKLAISSSF